MAPFFWKGTEIKTYADIARMVLTLDQPKELRRFMECLIASKGKQVEAAVFQVMASRLSLEKAKQVFTDLFDKDLNDIFFVVEAGCDAWGNTNFPRCVMEVRLMQDMAGELELGILGPSDVASWPTASLTLNRFYVTDGPARSLTFAEWQELTGFVSADE